MCGRFTLTSPFEAAAALFDAAPDGAHRPSAGPRWNICPTQGVDAVIAGPGGARRLTTLRWGFIPRWYARPDGGPLLINARSETIAEKPAFRDACRARRCLIPATGFYEWQPPSLSGGRGKVPHHIHPRDGGLFAFAGVWEAWRAPDGTEIVACAMVTAAAGPDMARLHHREPVRIDPADFALWLGEAGRGAATLMHAAPDGWFAAHPVSPRINGIRANDPLLAKEWRPEDGPPPSPTPRHRAFCCDQRSQRAAAASSASRASTQWAPSGVVSFFQNGALVLR
jgi:putative SOS response-associated peptidase YedK